MNDDLPEGIVRGRRYPQTRRSAKRPDKPIEGNNKIAVGYLRVSTEEQDLGPDAQRAAIEAWAKPQRLYIAAWVTEHVSGAHGLEKRPGITEAVKLVKENEAGCVVVARRDRLARDPLIMGTIEHLFRAAGAKVLSADGIGNKDDPSSQLIAAIIDGFSAYERAIIRERTRAALQVKKKRGERVGGIPYGYFLAADKVRLIPHVKEQMAIARAKVLRGYGLSYPAIANQLAIEGFWSRTAKVFDHTQVNRMCRTPDPTPPKDET